MSIFRSTKAHSNNKIAKLWHDENGFKVLRNEIKMSTPARKLTKSCK